MAHSRLFSRPLLVGVLAIGATLGIAAAVSRAQGPGFGPSRMGHHGPHGGFGPFGGGGGRGGEMDPEMMADRVDFGVRWALDRIDATDEQKEQVSEVFQKAAADLKAIHEEQKEEREAMRDAIVALDKAKVETLRVASMARADQASKRLTDAFLEAGALLSETQRQKLADTMESRRHGPGFREWRRR